MARIRRTARWWSVVAALAATGVARADDGGAPPGPTIRIEAPAEGALLATREIRVAGRVDVPEGVSGGATGTLILDDKAVDVKDGRFEATVTARADGRLRLRAVYGAVGAPAVRAERTVVVDTTPPALEVIEPSSATHRSPSPVARVRVAASDVHLGSVTMNGRAVARASGDEYEAEFVLPTSGEVTVEILAIDRAGNRSAVARRTLVHDPQGPEGEASHGSREGDPGRTDPGFVPLGPEELGLGAFSSRTSAPLKRGEGTAGNAVTRALEWLAAHQSPDGGWEAAGFDKWCNGKADGSTRTDGAGKPTYDVGVTGLSLLAFLGAGYTSRGDHEFSKVVQSGLRYLKNVQDPEGCFGARTGSHFIYNHGIATLAMVEAYGMTGSALFKAPAQKGLDFVAIARNPYFAWRYGVKPGENDTSVTGWMTMALRSARLVNQAAVKAGRPAPLLIDEDAFDGVRSWLDKMTDPDYGRVGYVARGSGPARPSDLVDRFPTEKSESMTAVGVFLRILLGEDPKHSALIQKGAELMRRLPPRWEPGTGAIDMYYWYYATLAMFQVGGEPWRQWNAAMKTAFIDTQRKDGDACSVRGSWDPLDPWGPDGGRVYSTAIMALSLEVFYRYERVFAPR
jgi:hypothetical protein